MFRDEMTYYRVVELDEPDRTVVLPPRSDHHSKSYACPNFCPKSRNPTSGPFSARDPHPTDYWPCFHPTTIWVVHIPIATHFFNNSTSSQQTVIQTPFLGRKSGFLPPGSGGPGPTPTATPPSDSPMSFAYLIQSSSRSVLPKHYFSRPKSADREKTRFLANCQKLASHQNSTPCIQPRAP